jgi:hypothetical protein
MGEFEDPHLAADEAITWGGVRGVIIEPGSEP